MRLLLTASAALVLVLVSGAPSRAQAPLAAAEREPGVWLDVPFAAQDEDGCGAAAIAMVLQYWKAQGTQIEKQRLDAKAIFDRLYSPKARGIFASDMQRYLRESGFTVFALQGTWDDLRQQLAKGRPLIAGLRPAAKRSALHYVVITGAGASGETVLVNDPAKGKLLRLGRPEFEKEWAAVNHWLLLAVPNWKK